MKIYVAARFYEKERVRNLYEVLKQNGHTITTDWTQCNTKLPLSDFPDGARHCAEHTVTGVKDCEIFIFLTSPEIGAGSSMEFGMALMLREITGLPYIYIVGPYINHHFGFYHSSVAIKNSVEEVLDEINSIKLINKINKTDSQTI